MKLTEYVVLLLLIVDVISESWCSITVATSTQTTVAKITASKEPSRETTKKGETAYILVRILVKQFIFE